MFIDINMMRFFRRHNLLDSDAELDSMSAIYLTEEVYLALLCLRHVKYGNNPAIDFCEHIPKVPLHLKSEGFYIKCLDIIPEAMFLIEPEYLTVKVFETFIRLYCDFEVFDVVKFTSKSQWTEQVRLCFVQAMMNMYWGHAAANAPVLTYTRPDFHTGLHAGTLNYFKKLVSSKAENIKYVEPKYLVREVFSAFPGDLSNVITNDMIPHEHWSREVRLAYAHSFIFGKPSV